MINIEFITGKQVLKDPKYIARLKRHYQMFKVKVDPKHFPPSRAQESDALPASPRKKRHRSRSR